MLRRRDKKLLYSALYGNVKAVKKISKPIAKGVGMDQRELEMLASMLSGPRVTADLARSALQNGLLGAQAMSERSARKPKPVHLKHLMNDLERETEINKRVKMQLEKQIDQPRQFGPESSNLAMSTASFIPFSSFPIGRL